MQIGNKERPISFGMNTWVIYCQENEITITEMSEQLQKIGSGGGSGAELRDLIWAALKAGAIKNKQPFEFDKWDVGFWLDDIEQEALNAFLQDMSQSLQSNIPENGTDTKKKTTDLQQ